jgi:hypothetical protein
LAWFMPYKRGQHLASELDYPQRRYSWINNRLLFGLITGHERLVIEINPEISIVNNIAHSIFFRIVKICDDVDPMLVPDIRKGCLIRTNQFLIESVTGRVHSFVYNIGRIIKIDVELWALLDD